MSPLFAIIEPFSFSSSETGWRDKIHVYTKEIEDAEHREMLASDGMFVVVGCGGWCICLLACSFS